MPTNIILTISKKYNDTDIINDYFHSMIQFQLSNNSLENHLNYYFCHIWLCIDCFPGGRYRYRKQYWWTGPYGSALNLSFESGTGSGFAVRIPIRLMLNENKSRKPKFTETDDIFREEYIFCSFYVKLHIFDQILSYPQKIFAVHF